MREEGLYITADRYVWCVRDNSDGTGKSCRRVFSKLLYDNSATVENSAAYIQGWSNAIKADRRLVVMSACAAQRAADHILGITYDDNDK